MNERERFEEGCKAGFRVEGIHEKYFEILLKFVDEKYIQQHIQNRWVGYQAATAESAARIAELEQKMSTASKSIRYLQKHRLWINSHAKAVIDTAVDAVTNTGDKTQ